jgi:IS30 family transposase
MPGARLSLEEREEIALGIASGRSLTGIARGVGRPVSTVARRWPGTVVAERATRRRACRPKQRRLAVDRALGREVERRLRLRHSPQATREPAALGASG